MPNLHGRRYWFQYYGVLPPKGTVVDHINRDQTDNRKENLRLATYSQNGMNSVYPNQHGHRGITFDVERNKWQAQIRIDGVKTNLGRFKTKEEAIEAYQQAAMKHHGEFMWNNQLKPR